VTTSAPASRPDYPDEVRLPSSPRVEERDGERWYWVAPVEALLPGTRAILEIEGREVGIFNVGGRYFAFRNRCPHLGGPLCGGKVLDLVISSEGPGDIRLEPTSPMLVCPWHGWEFDLSSGQSYCDPHRWRARRYQVNVEQVEAPLGERVAGPYKAEPYKVVIADAYVVVVVTARRRVSAGS
jgi:3-phenylpropionate/trans-cinnamate dioxygenase ferredoxin subunit